MILADQGIARRLVISEADFSAVTSLVAEGVTLTKACKRVGVSMASYNDARLNNAALDAKYVRARELGAECLIWQAQDSVDDDADLFRVRLKIDLAKYTASKHNARVYGERIQVDSTQTLELGPALAEALSRQSLPMRDQQHQVIDVTPTESRAYALSDADKVSEASGVQDAETPKRKKRQRGPQA